MPQPFTKQAKIVDLAACFNFSRPEFEKQLSLSIKGTVGQAYKWSLVRLGAVAEIRNGGTPDTNRPEYWDGGIAWATLVDTKTKYLYSTQRTISAEGLSNSNAVLLPKNTVIFSSRATIGEITIPKIEVSTNQGYKNFVCNPALINYEYLYLILKREAENIADLASGLTYPEISKEQISNYKIPLPPLEIQKLIVKEIAAVEKVEEPDRKIIEKMRKEISRKADALFAHHSLEKLGRVCEEPEYGAAEKALIGNPQTDYRYIRITDVDGNGALLDKEFMTAEHIEAKYILRDGDFLFARSGNTVGKTFLFRQHYGNAIFAGYFIRFRCKTNALLPRFLDLITKSQNYKDWVSKTRGGASQPNINATQYSSYQIPLPSTKEQHKAITEFEVLEKPITEAAARLSQVEEKKADILRKHLEA